MSYIYIIMNMHVMCMFLPFVLIQYIVYILFGWDMFVICDINSRWYIFFQHTKQMYIFYIYLHVSNISVSVNEGVVCFYMK